MGQNLSLSAFIIGALVVLLHVPALAVTTVAYDPADGSLTFENLPLGAWPTIYASHDAFAGERHWTNLGEIGAGGQVYSSSAPSFRGTVDLRAMLHGADELSLKPAWLEPPLWPDPYDEFGIPPYVAEATTFEYHRSTDDWPTLPLNVLTGRAIQQPRVIHQLDLPASFTVPQVLLPGERPEWLAVSIYSHPDRIEGSWYWQVEAADIRIVPEPSTTWLFAAASVAYAVVRIPAALSRVRRRRGGKALYFAGDDGARGPGM